MDTECYRCGKANHFAGKYKSNQPKVQTVNESATENDSDSNQSDHFKIREIKASCKQAKAFVLIKLSTGTKVVSFKLATGSQLNIRSFGYTPNEGFNLHDKLQLQPYDSTRKQQRLWISILFRK